MIKTYSFRCENALLYVPFIEADEQLVQPSHRHYLAHQMKAAMHAEDHLHCITVVKNNILVH